jgi:hypothetical protein
MGGKEGRLPISQETVPLLLSGGRGSFTYYTYHIVIFKLSIIIILAIPPNIPPYHAHSGFQPDIYFSKYQSDKERRFVR